MDNKPDLSEDIQNYVKEVQLIHEKYLKGKASVCLFIADTEGITVYGTACPTCMVVSYLNAHIGHSSSHHEQECMHDLEIINKTVQ